MSDLSQAPPGTTEASDGPNGRRGDLPIIAIDLPVLFEDEGQEEMGESLPHSRTEDILWNGIAAHLAPQPRYRVLPNLNLHYHPIERTAYVSPDTMVVAPRRPLPDEVASYRVREDGPPPVLVAEVLSRRTFQQQDLTNKPVIYADLGVAEYILVDVTGRYLPQRLLLKRLRRDGTWKDEQDPDGGVTSRLGFRVIIDADGQVRVLDAKTGRPYARPDEAEAEAEARRRAERKQKRAEQKQRRAEEKQREADEARRQAEERVRQLEAELARLRGTPPA
jgi:Uma2 family endonuclease